MAMPDPKDDEVEGETEAEEARKAEEAAKAKEKRRLEFVKKYVPRAEHEKVKADLANALHEKEVDDDGTDEGKPEVKPAPKPKPKPVDPAPEEKGPPKRFRIFPFPHEE